MKFSYHTTKTTEEIFAELKTTKTGLDKKEATKRFDKYGPNEIATKEVRWQQIFFRQFKSPFIYLLAAAALLSFLLGENINGVLILIFVGINSALGFFQEYHAEKALKLLKKYIISRARVRRENQEVIIDSRQVVPGDLVIVEAGDIIPADIRFLEQNNLMVNEQILTGESVPISKIDTPLKKEETEIYQAKNIGFSGTTVTSGKGVGVVIATGKNTIFGQIARLTGETLRESTFAKGIQKFSKFILRLIVVTLVFVFLANIIIKQEPDPIELLIFSIALAVSVIPEALPVVTTVSLSRGALRLAKSKVIVKRLSSIEDLGSMEILCTDKTGTLTENILTVDKILAENEKECLSYISLAAPFLGEKKREPNNAFDIALWQKLPKEEKTKISNYKRIAEIPFDPVRRCNSVLIEKNNLCELIVRGAPEVIFDACDISKSERKKLDEWTSQEGKMGRRVLAVAKKKFKKVSHYSEKEESGLSLIGVVSFVDPIKKTAKQTIKHAHNLKLKIKILTGDSPEVAGAVAYEVGLAKSPEEVITGEKFFSLTPAEQLMAAEKYSVFARVSPEQKYQIIQLLQKKYEVGFLGEGINDAPALKIANVALAVSGAADIAREASDVILLKKSLEVIVDGVKMGREIFANTLKYIKITLASNFGNFYAIAVASLLITFLPMLPVQILLVNLLSDFPMIAIATDKVDRAELKRPRAYNVKDIVFITTILGLVSTIFDFIFFGLFYRISPGVLQTNWFIGSILTELVLIFSLRSVLPFFKASRPSPTLFWLSAAAFAATIIIPLTNAGQKIFYFVKPQTSHLILILVIVVCYFVVTESVKLFYHRILNHKANQQLS